MNVDEWLSSVNMDTLGLEDEEYLVRTPSRTSIVTDSSGVRFSDLAYTVFTIQIH